MGRRLLLSLLLSAWAVGLLGCGSGGGAPVQDTRTFKQQRPRMPQAPPGQQK